MDSLLTQLQEIAEKADYLNKRVAELADENRKLKQMLHSAESRLQHKEAELGTVKEQADTLKLARITGNGGVPNEAADELKKRISRYIREIDQTLKLINE